MPETGPCQHNNRTYTDVPQRDGSIIVQITCATCGVFLGTYKKA